MPLPPWISDLPALDLLLSVAETGSVGRAAQAHAVSQPSASAHLTRLERRLGVTLLVRSRRGSELTPAGQAVVTWARPVVEAAHALADSVLALRADRQARLRVAASLTVAEYLLPAWLLGLRRRHPDLEISADVANSDDVCAAVRAGSADIGFVEAPDIPGDLSGRIVGEDRLALVVAAGYPLATRAAGGLRPIDLLEQPLLLREPGSGTRSTFLRSLEAALRMPLGDPRPGSQAEAGTRADLGPDGRERAPSEPRHEGQKTANGGPRRERAGAEPPLPHATNLGSTATILATARAGGGIGVISARAAVGAIATGELVELHVDGLQATRPLHAVWLGEAPTGLAAELVTFAVAGR